MKLIKSGTILRSDIHYHKVYKDVTPRPIQKDFNKMFDDVNSFGQLRPVCLDEKFYLVDGYTRDEILGKLRQDKIKFTQYSFDDEQEKIDYINSMNVKRRHLSEYQRFEVVFPSYEKIKNETKPGPNNSASRDAQLGKATTKAAKEADMSTKTFERCLNIKQKATPDQIEKVRTKTTGIKTLESQLTKKDRNEPTVELPKGKFDVILCDVPIAFDDKGGRGSAENHYSTMSAQDLSKMKIPSSENAVIFFWMSPSVMYGVISNDDVDRYPVYQYILDAWNFENVKGEFVWDKQIIGLGSYNRNQHENCLIAFKGKMPVPLELHSSIISEKRTRHSKKPESFYSIIEKMYPKRNYLELFGRQKREGWTVFGNQIEELNPDVELPTEKLQTRTSFNCKFCGTVCKNFLIHLEKYHKKQINTEYFPKTEKGAKSFFKSKEMPI